MWCLTESGPRSQPYPVKRWGLYIEMAEPQPWPAQKPNRESEWYGGVPGDVTHFSAGHLLAARLILA
jgi:hypothetical protein